MNKPWLRIDLALLAGVVVLITIGTLLILPFSAELARQQLLFGLIGLILIVILGRTDYRLFRVFGVQFYLGSLLILIALRLFGEEIRGSIRWFSLGRYQLQPSEFLKPFLILAVAGFIEKVDFSKFKSLAKLAVLMVVPVIFIFLQPDLGNTAIYLSVFMIMLVVGGLPPILLLIGSLALVTILPPVWFVLRDYQRQRLLSFLNPTIDPLGSGYHTIQSLIAVGSGGLFGKGIGQGTQSRLEFLPEQHNDFIFATLAEETGLIGATLVLLVFSFLLWRIMRIADQAPDRFSSLMVVGLAAQFLIQMVVNGGMNLGLLPVTGVNFPFLSYGGSSLIGSLIGIGLIQSVGSKTERHPAIDIS